VPVEVEQQTGNITATSTTPISEARRKTVDKARQDWIRKLIDPSRRNNLLYFRPLKTGTLDLSSAPAEQMAQLLSGQPVQLAKLDNRDESPGIVREIGRRALSNAEEKGLQTLFLALGLATWRADDDGRPPESPVLLVPLEVKASGRAGDSFTLSRAGAVQANLVLLHALDELGVKCSPEELIPHLLGDDEGEPFDPRPLYDVLIERAASQVKDFAVADAAWLGNFAFQKMAMVKDLQERGTELAANTLVAAIAGDKDARISAGSQQVNVDPKELDRVPPENEFFVLDADSSQQCAVDGVLNGESAVVHGPPGTGKSQTIVNLIATLAANGKRALFVAEKRAALEVVLRRLRDVGLDHLAIDLHGADVAPKRVMEQIARTLETVRHSTPVDANGTHARLVDRRARLNAHVERIHIKRAPAGKSVYELQGLLLLLSRKADSKSRWRGPELAKLTPEIAASGRDLLCEAAGFAPLFLRTDPSPWTGAGIRDGVGVQSALSLVRRIHEQSLPVCLRSLEVVAEATGLAMTGSMKELRSALATITDVQHTLTLYSPDLFGADLRAVIAQLEAAHQGGFSALWAFATDARYRAARAKMLALRSAGKAKTGDIYAEVAEAAAQQQRWQAAGLSRPPAVVAAFEQHKAACAQFWTDLDQLEQVLAREVRDMALDSIKELVTQLVSDSITPTRLPKLLSIETKLDQYGLRNFVAELRSNKPLAELWPVMFDIAWYSSTLDAACESDPEIRGFNGTTHGSFAAEFADLDVARIRIAAGRVRRAHAERAVAAMNAHREQELLIRAESQKSRRHLPLRRVFAQAAEVLTAVCPCWMASPLSVSQLLDSGKQYFDYVIFDEASQVLPEDAVCSLLRGERLVVAGDRNQLPPTTFFSASTDDDLVEAEEEASDGYESLLDMMNSFLPSHYLDWHYRSRDEALIAFSNHHIYRDRLVTFPGPGGPPAIKHVHVDQPAGADGQEESSSAEAQKVIDLILQHARVSPSETLGVITMGIKHRDRVQAALDKALRDRREFADFFDESKTERFFVKNLEAVQGDERDAILISIGYGKDRSGNLPFRFGPLIPEGGRRRLNVAVTRARRRLSLVSSFTHLDMDLARVRPGSGVELLRNYLEYAASGGKRLGDVELTTVPPNDFEQDVYDALSPRGLRLIPQVGASRFRLDLVAEHPTQPGRYVLAIECDGATYHSSNTARDRDRLRQRQLENLGWRFHRIWSTDWFMRKQEEVERAVAAFEKAVKLADSELAVEPRVAPADLQAEPQAPKLGAVERGPKPVTTGRGSISDYSLSDLIQLIRWVGSDGLVRTEDEITREMIQVLGFARRGARIESAIRAAIRSTGQQ
jgi:very-short-patch-repair endonuclease